MEGLNPLYADHGDVGVAMEITDNVALSSVDALQGLTSIGTASPTDAMIYITSNPVLPQCVVDAWAEQLVEFQGFLASFSNDGGAVCN